MNLLSFSGSGLVAVVSAAPAGQDALYTRFYGVTDSSHEVTKEAVVTENGRLRVEHTPSTRMPIRPFGMWLKNDRHLKYFVREADARNLDVVKIPSYVSPGGEVDQALEQYRLLLPAGAVSEQDIQDRLASVGHQFPYRELTGYLRSDHHDLIQKMLRWREKQDPSDYKEFSRRLVQLSTDPELDPTPRNSQKRSSHLDRAGPALAGYDRVGLNPRRLKAYTTLALQLQERGMDEVYVGLAKQRLEQELRDEIITNYFPEI